ncbi:hypothetical protein BBJ28_00014776 [Nothophytophthora sp. Chile5]|nr:hypothetical protein BBJ28_00014776 [Nothophytophthora sp. Chile5]
MQSPFVLSLFAALAGSAMAGDFAKMDEALPSGIDLSSIYPLLDFTNDSCLPSAGISRNGTQNPGIAATDGITTDCRNADFNDLSNTYHRYACVDGPSSVQMCGDSGNSTYCGHFFSIYTTKDMDNSTTGHTNDWEKVIVWTEDGVATYGSYSYHATVGTAAASDIPQEDGHLKFVYYKEEDAVNNLYSHCFRFAEEDEEAQNPNGEYFLPTVVSWYTMEGDNTTTAELQDDLNTYDYGKANFPQTDSIFLAKLNKFKPETFPNFTQNSVDISQ